MEAATAERRKCVVVSELHHFEVMEVRAKYESIYHVRFEPTVSSAHQDLGASGRGGVFLVTLELK